jgi:dTDP-4-amino-4,6-dideoxygalactose transaminase
MVTTNDPALAEQVRVLRNQGQATRYYQTAPGYNLRMTEIQAAIGLVQLGKLECFTQQRITNAAFLTKHLGKSIQTPIARPGYRHVYHQYVIQVPGQREEWMARLQAKGIGTAIHYPLAIYQQPFYRSCPERWRLFQAPGSGVKKSSQDRVGLPITERAAARVLSLPVYPDLRADELATIAAEVTALCI